MTVLTKNLIEIRCKSCHAKLGEYAMEQGEIRIMCMKNLGKGRGSCKTLNIVKIQLSNP